VTKLADLIGANLPDRPVAGFNISELERYCEVSGDDNVIHRDPVLARAAGLSDCAVHGMLIASQFEETIRRWRDDVELVASSTRFVRPAIVGETLVFSGRVVAASTIEAADLIVRVDVRGTGGKILSVADIHIRLARDVRA
jgi:acyl dehydratase